MKWLMVLLIALTGFLCLLEFFFWQGGSSVLVLLSYLSFLLLFVSLVNSGSINLYSPFVYLFGNLLIGVSIRSFVMATYRSNEVDRLFLRGEIPEYFAEILVYVLFAIVSFLIGYKFTALNSRPSRNSKHEESVWTRKGIVIFDIVFISISVLGTIVYISKMGIADSLLMIQNVSSKRHLLIEGKSAALGYQRWAASLVSLVFYVHWILFLRADANDVKEKPSRQKLLVLFALSLFLPFITSSRSSALFVIINALIIFSMFRRIYLTQFIIVLSLGLILFQAMTQLRRKSVGSEITDEKVFGLLEPIIMNRNLMDLSKTAHIMNAVPGKLDYLYGSSYLSILYAPVPRVLWANKPDINIGVLVAVEVYGMSRSLQTAIPPGIVGELYINFGLVGILLGPLLIGFMFRKFVIFGDLQIARQSPRGILLYTLLLLPLTIYLPGSSLVQAAIRIIQLYVTYTIADRLLRWN